MNHIAKLLWVAAFTVAAVLLPVGVFAQDSEPPAAIPGASSSLEDSVQRMRAVVESALATMEADPAIEDAARDLLRPKYEQAIEALKDAASSATREAEYRESMTHAPDTTAELRTQLEELPSVESAGDVTAAADPDDLRQALDAQRAFVAALSEQLSSVTGDSSLAEQRPVEIIARIPEAERELADARRQLASPDLTEDNTSPGRVADRFLLQARELKLANELVMLQQEQLSLSVRRILQQVQRVLLTRQVENASAAVAAYEALMNKSVTNVARDIRTRAEGLRLEVRKDDPEAVALALEVQELATQLERVPQDRQKISTAKADVTTKLRRLTQRYDSIKRQLELGQPGGEMAQVLIDLRALLTKRVQGMSEMCRWPTLVQTRLAAVQVDFKIDSQSDMQKQFADRSSRAVENLIVARGEVLDKLQRQYLDLIPMLSSLESETRLYLDKAGEIRSEITQQLFWVRISPPLSASTLSEVPHGLRWVFGREHWSECVRALKNATSRAPIGSAIIVLIAIVLLIMRAQIGGALRRTGDGVGRVSTDRFGLTVRAVLWTASLALPVPLVVGFVAWSLSQTGAPSDWMRDINRGMPSALVIVSATTAFAACCYPGGLGAVHHGWRKEWLSWLRQASHWFAFIYTPLTLLAYCTVSSESGRFLHGVGCASFLLAHAWMLVFFARLFYSSEGFYATLNPENPIRTRARLRYLLPFLGIGYPLALMVLAGLGYTMAAGHLSFAFVLTLIIIVGGVIFYALGLRWFKIEHRKLAFAEALERRRARQEAAPNEGPREESGEVVSVDEDEQVMDLDSVGEQTLHLLRLLFGLGIAAAVLSLWSTTLPLVPYLDSIRIPMTVEFTLLELSKAALVVGVTWIATRNLPGMLELTVLRATSLDAGTRHAITTICQYAVVTTGLVLLFSVLNLDWAKFGWIAGGLSVGIGFGMQEIVANFVCGLILLLERPIRVGDVVTVEGVTGTVTRIRMRATMITNWDRQEFVVPNKTLITNTLLNWTLSAPLNRIIIPVGVAYGSNTEQARQILLDVAADHPRILDDPTPMATFEAFADSSLTLSLRAFIPNLENRTGTITELHTEIHSRFAEAGIEIAFPQSDLHLRGGWELLAGQSRPTAGVDRNERSEGHTS